MRIALFFGSCLVVAALVACVGGPGPVSEDPLNQTGSSQTGENKDDKKDEAVPGPPGNEEGVQLPPRDDAG